MSGLGTDAIRWIPVDAAMRMDVEALQNALALDESPGRHAAARGRQRRVGEHRRHRPAAGDRRGLPARRRLVPRGRRLRGLRGGGARRLSGDSRAGRGRFGRHRPAQVALRPARGRVRAGAIGRRAARAFAYHPPYYHFGVEATNFVDLGPQNSRGFRALKVWLALAPGGPRGLRAHDRGRHRLSEHLFARTRAARRVRGRDAGPEHHDVPLRAGRPAARARGRRRRAVSRRAQSRAAGRTASAAARPSSPTRWSAAASSCARASSTSTRRSRTSRRCRRSSPAAGRALDHRIRPQALRAVR